MEMGHRQQHFEHQTEPKVLRKVPDRGNTRPDKYEVLQDENKQLKTQQNQLELQVQQISTRLMRQINQLNSSKVVGGRSAMTKNFEKDLESLIDQNLRLEHEENELRAKVLKKQGKKKRELASANKNLYPVVDQMHDRKGAKADLALQKTVRDLQAAVDNSMKKVRRLEGEVQSAKRQSDPGISYEDISAEKSRIKYELE
jgi:predicted  nucleic acid-binding Zn-ribbon protein